MSGFINTIQVVYHSHHVRSVLGKEVVSLHEYLLRSVFGFDIPRSTGLFLAILRTANESTEKKVGILRESRFASSLFLVIFIIGFNGHYDVI